jgi:hypothetical protein
VALHVLRNRTLFKWLKCCSKKKGSEYQELEYSQPSTPEDNTIKLMQLIKEGNEWGRSRTKESAEMLGHLFSCFLLIEHKLSLLLVGFCPDIGSRMFGQKIQVLKDFVKEVEKTCPYEFDVQHHRNMIAPLKQVKTLRDTLAHDITVINPSSIDLTQVHNFVSKFRPDLAASYSEAESEDLKAIGGIVSFAFILSVELGKLRIYLK